MPKFLIEPSYIPTANLDLQTPISAGLGWLDPVKCAVSIAASEPILSIKEKAGTLTVISNTHDAAKRDQLGALREASASICEICCEPGTLADLGIDSVELGEWVVDQVERGHWPEGDLLEAFRIWRSQKNTSNAVP